MWSTDGSSVVYFTSGDSAVSDLVLGGDGSGGTSQMLWSRGRLDLHLHTLG